MLLCKTLILLFLLASGIKCEDSRCSKYDFEEKVLEKMVRIEFQMERMKNEVEQCVSTVEHIKTEVGDQMKKNQQELGQDLVVQKEEVANVTALVHAKLQELKSQSDNYNLITPIVGFKAILNEDSAVTIGQAIVFPTVIFNEGDAYNSHTGMFTVSVSGIYMFSVAFCVYDSKGLDISIIIEGKKYTTSYFYGDAGQECLSADTVAIVTTGQRVWMEGIPGTSRGTILDQDSHRWNTFSGALINLTK